MLQTFYDLFNYCAVMYLISDLFFFTHGERELSSTVILRVNRKPFFCDN